MCGRSVACFSRYADNCKRRRCLTRDHQILTDLRPYATYNEISVVLAIAQGRSPANIKDIEVPAFVALLLERCWQMSSDSRPYMMWCSEVLAQRTNALFNAYCSGPRERIPLEYKNGGDGWLSVRNPDSAKVYDLYFGSCPPVIQ